MNDYAVIARDALWRANPGLVQLLGLCPLLAVSNTLVNALALGLATLFVLLVTNTLVSLLRHSLVRELRIPAYVLIIASTVTVVEQVMHAWFTELYVILGIFIPIITTNCIIIGRAEAFASRHSLPHALADGAMTGLGFLLVLVALGGLREGLAQGTLFDGAELLFGDAAAGLTLGVPRAGAQLAALPAGAFIGLGLLVAAKNALDARRPRRATAPAGAVRTS